jgi:hypothetical protein
MSRRVLIALAVLLAACTAAHAGPIPCEASDKQCILKLLRASPAKQLSTWQSAFAKPLEERVGLAPPEVIELLTLDNLFHGYPERPHPSHVADDLRADVVAALAAMPEPVKKRLANRLAGIVFVDEFGGTGFTDSIADEGGRKTRAFVVLDPTVLEKRTANTWATWKENTPFKPDGRHELKATIEKAGDDVRRQAIQYILLHELGHALAVGEKFDPDWNLRASEVPDERYPFFDLSWTLDRARDRYVNRFADPFPEFKSVVYYFGAKLPASGMAETYSHLERTNFPTLYAVTHPGDDFAESFANYVHVVMMGKPFEIVISEDGRVTKRYGACWNEERCAAKRSILESFLR